MAEAYRIVARHPGGPEVFAREAISPPQPGPGEVALRQTAVGVNFIDIYLRDGLYPWPPGQETNHVLGSEGAGVVEAVGAGVTEFRPGDRVAYGTARGAFASHRVVPASALVPLPASISDDVAAAIMLKGLTAYYLIHQSHPVQAGETVLVHAAAGGVGQILGPWLKLKGVRAIGTAGGPEKAALLGGLGYAEAIDYRNEDFVARVKEITRGEGVAAVYDGVGKDTILGSAAVLKTFGTLVSFGQSSGMPDNFRIAHLATTGGSVTRPTLFHFAASRDWLLKASAALFEAVGSGAIPVRIDSLRPLEEIGAVQTDLAERRTVGATVLKP